MEYPTLAVPIQDGICCQGYWVVDVEEIVMTAYAIGDGGSKLMRISHGLPGLDLSTIESALYRSRKTDQSQVGAW